MLGNNLRVCIFLLFLLRCSLSVCLITGGRHPFEASLGDQSPQLHFRRRSWEQGMCKRGKVSFFSLGILLLRAIIINCGDDMYKCFIH